MRNLALMCLALTLTGCAGMSPSDGSSAANDPMPQRGVSSAVAGDQVNTPRTGEVPAALVPGMPPK
jgi:hypothetical protein